VAGTARRGPEHQGRLGGPDPGVINCTPLIEDNAGRQQKLERMALPDARPRGEGHHRAPETKSQHLRVRNSSSATTTNRHRGGRKVSSHLEVFEDLLCPATRYSQAESYQRVERSRVWSCDIKDNLAQARYPLPHRTGIRAESLVRTPPGFAPEPPPNLLPTFTDVYILTSSRD
jgi:hypothetical protein